MNDLKSESRNGSTVLHVMEQQNKWTIISDNHKSQPTKIFHSVKWPFIKQPKMKSRSHSSKRKKQKKCARKNFSCDIWKMFEKREIMIDILKCFLPSIYYVYDVIGDFNLIFFSLNFKVFLFLAHFPKIVMPWISV